MNRQAKIVSVQVLNGQGEGKWSSIIAGLNYVYKTADDIKKCVVNMSIGGPNSEAIRKVVGYMTKRGFRVVVAAGNEGADACQSSPANSEGVVAVGAFDEQAGFASFSNRGECVTILAPGVNILSLYPGRKLAFLSGTSMASPIVAGVWSLNLTMSAKDLKTYGFRNGIKNLPADTTDNGVLVKDGDKIECTKTYELLNRLLFLGQKHVE